MHLSRTCPKYLSRTWPRWLPLLVAAAVACDPVSAAAPPKKPPAKQPPAKQQAADPVVEASVADLQKAMQSGKLTSRALTQRYLDRIKAIDKAGPTLNAVIEVNPDALKDAEAMDAER